MKKKILALALVGAALLSGCASVPKDSGQNPDDPWETLNRQTFAFNQGLDFILIRPLAKGYQSITPKPVRACSRTRWSRLMRSTMFFKEKSKKAFFPCSVS